MLKKPETKLLRSFRSSILPQQMSNPSILPQLRDGYRESWRNRHELGKEFHWTLKPLMSSQEETTDRNTSSHWFMWHARVSDKTLHSVETVESFSSLFPFYPWTTWMIIAILWCLVHFFCTSPTQRTTTSCSTCVEPVPPGTGVCVNRLKRRKTCTMGLLAICAVRLQFQYLTTAGGHGVQSGTMSNEATWLYGKRSLISSVYLHRFSTVDQAVTLPCFAPPPLRFPYSSWNWIHF